MKAVLARASSSLPGLRWTCSRYASTSTSSPSSSSFYSNPSRLSPSFLCNGPLSHPTFALGNEVFVQGSNAIVGLSAANSYYNRERTSETVAWASTWFKRTYAFIPGTLSRYTFQAKGHSHTKSRQKAVQAENRLRRFAEEGYRRSIQRDANLSNQVFMPMWETYIQNHPVFYESLFHTRELFYDNAAFRSAVHDSCLEVATNNRRPNASDSIEASVDLAREFLLQELAFLWSCDEIFDETEPLVYIYHRRWPVFEHFASGKFFEDGRPLENIGFLVVKMNERQESSCQ